MKTTDAIKFAGGATSLAGLLRITPGAISQWGEYPPDRRQIQLEKLSKSLLSAEPGCLDRVLGLEQPAAEA